MANEHLSAIRRTAKIIDTEKICHCGVLLKVPEGPKSAIAASPFYRNPRLRREGADIERDEVVIPRSNSLKGTVAAQRKLGELYALNRLLVAAT